MKRKEFEEIIKESKLDEDTWLTFNCFESIILNSGRYIFPNWKCIKFLIHKDKIYIRYGRPTIYGASLTGRYSIGIDGLDLRLDPSNLIPKGNFRPPMPGDIIRMTEGNYEISSSIIIDTFGAGNSFSIEVSKPFSTRVHGLLSFYDPTLYDKDKCFHSDIEEGEYYRFEIESGKYDKQFGVYHEIIKIKDIKEIRNRRVVYGR